MKPLCTLCLLLVIAMGASLAAQPVPAPAQDYAGLLQRYAKPDGVRYAALAAAPEDKEKLARYVAALAAPESPRFLPVLINAYNANMLALVLQHYPICSVTEIAPDFGVFKNDLIVVSGEKMSLNRLEKELLIGHFGEPRIHFAINCASRSCPPLSPLLFTEDNVEAQLETLTREFLTKNPLGLRRISKSEVGLSAIFDWYRADFEKKGGVLGFINGYAAPKLDAKTKLTFQEYDWSLNAAKP